MECLLSLFRLFCLLALPLLPVRDSQRLRRVSVPPPAGHRMRRLFSSLSPYIYGNAGICPGAAQNSCKYLAAAEV